MQRLSKQNSPRPVQWITMNVYSPCFPNVRTKTALEEEDAMPIILWLLGVPLTLLVVLWFFGVLSF